MTTIWTPSDDRCLLENYQILSQKQLSDLTGHPTSAVRSRLIKLGLLISSTAPAVVERICQYNDCRAIFYCEFKELTKGNGLYCSHSCRARDKKKKIPTKDQLIYDYLTLKLSTTDIATKYNISKGVVYNRFKEYGIKARSLLEAQAIFYNTDKGQQKNLLVADKRHLNGTYSNRSFTSTKFKNGFKKDTGIKARSMWEQNIARYFIYNNIEWQYEPKRFMFDAIKRGVRSYVPDFYLPRKGLWVEVKGYCPKEDITRLRRFRIYYPEEFKNLQAIVDKPGCQTELIMQKLGVPIYAYYTELNKQYKNIIPYWGE